MARFPKFSELSDGKEQMARANWYAEHPPACTCNNCEEKKAILRREGRKIGRNEKCPCGSNKKYKRCHGG